MAKYINKPSSSNYNEPTSDRKQTKQEIEKYRRDRMNVSMEELKGYLVRFIPNQTTKLEKADILEQTVTLVGRLIAEKERAFSEGVKRGMLDVCNMLMKSGVPEAQKAAHDIMISIRPQPAIHMPPGVPPMPRLPLPPVPPPFGFMGFPGLAMGIPPPPPMMPQPQPQQTAMKLHTPVPQLLQQPRQAGPTMETVTALTPEKGKVEIEHNDQGGETSSEDEEIDIENVDDRHEETFSDASTVGSNRSGSKRKHSSSDDDSGIADIKPSKVARKTNEPTSMSFGIDRFLMP